MKHAKHLILSLAFVAGFPLLSPPGAVKAQQISFVNPARRICGIAAG
jgi:hypothetical protein